jgi:hypothetical protein
MEVIYQGHVATDGSTKIVCTTTSLTINTIIINNLDSNYVFNFNRFENGPGIHLIPIYELSLDAGDSIRDTESYVLGKDDYIQFVSDVPGTTYYIKATKEE